MKLIDEVAALSSIEALEALCPAYVGDGPWAAINQNLGALRQQLEGDAQQPAAWRMRWEESPGGWSDWLLCGLEPRERASRKTEIEALYSATIDGR